MNRLKNETDLQRFIRKSLGYYFYNECKFKKCHGNQYTEKGVSDIDGHVRGMYVAIEAKMWNGRPSNAQISFTRGVMKTGALGLYLVYEFDKLNNHNFYWVPGDMPFSYRTKMLWIRTGLIKVKSDPNPKVPDNGERVEIIDCSPILTLLEMKVTS